MQRRNLLWKLTEGAGLSMEPILGMPVIEIAGDCRVLIEYHKGVSEYTSDHISVKVRYGQVCVWGERLEVACMTSTQLIVRGNIHRLELVKGDEV